MELGEENDVFEDALEPDDAAASSTAASQGSDHPIERERGGLAGEVTRL
jgi:hypothetical protein